METKVFYQVNKLDLNSHSEAVIGSFEKKEDAINYVNLSKIAAQNYGFKVAKVTEENIFSTEE